MEGYYKQYRQKLNNLHVSSRRRIEEATEKNVKDVSKKVIDKLVSGTNFVSMQRDAKSGIFKIYLFF